MNNNETMYVNDKAYRVKKLLGRGKGGYSYLVSDGENDYVLKKIHHEPCDYYTFGDKLASELRDCETLRGLGIPLPRLIDADKKREHILKEYIEGETVWELLGAGKYDERWAESVREMCARLYPAGINIDYFPTNFVVSGGELFYIDYECSGYMEEWDFEHWGIKYWYPVRFENYTEADYDALCDFFIELNKNDRGHINWNWARFEWMYEHPGSDRSLINSIGLWKCGGRIVGAAVYDMYFGEAFCGALREYDHLYPQILEYASQSLSDEGGLATAVREDDRPALEALKEAGFTAIDQAETVMKAELDREFSARLPEGLELAEPDPVKDAYALQWLFWRGFDHGEDRAEFKREEEIIPRIRKHFDPRLALAAAAPDGEYAACCCLWYDKRTDYAYVEPVCTVPSYRGKGIAKALIYEALGRARDLGAKQAFVISDMEFYRKLGFGEFLRFVFYKKEKN